MINTKLQLDDSSLENEAEFFNALKRKFARSLAEQAAQRDADTEVKAQMAGKSFSPQRSPQPALQDANISFQLDMQQERLKKSSTMDLREADTSLMKHPRHTIQSQDDDSFESDE